MPLLLAFQIRSEYDVIAVGSGAGGGQAAYTLTLEGVKVLLLEAARNYVPEIGTPMLVTPEQAPPRSLASADKPFGFFDATVDGAGLRLVKFTLTIPLNLVAVSGGGALA
jgi:choline dehydrogenase-like flavoprotein